MRRPLAVNLVDQNDRSKAFTIVFYDIAGENCVKWNDDYAKLGDQDSRNSRAKEGIASFIARADGLMFLVDPNQVPGFSAYPDVSGVNKVVGVVNQIRVALNMSQNTWADVPVAVVLTKTDEIRNQYPKGNQSPMFRPTAAVSGEPGGVFCYQPRAGGLPEQQCGHDPGAAGPVCQKNLLRRVGHHLRRGTALCKIQKLVHPGRYLRQEV
jgi:hypothetical protein